MSVAGGYKVEVFSLGAFRRLNHLFSQLACNPKISTPVFRVLAVC
jgi:hypothetical protein